VQGRMERGTRLTPERELFEWALLDANKSGTAEACQPSSLDIPGETMAFIVSPLKERIWL